MKAAVVLLVAGLLAAILGGLALLYSGILEVAATVPHSPLTRWALETAMESGVRRRARGVEPAPFLAEEARVRAGAVAYDAMCAPCHGAPGRQPEAVGKGLLPEPPDLAEVAAAWSPGEIFWITKHGVRMTGMPAFGPTHTDAELWEVVALVERLAELSPADYRVLTASPAGRHSHPGR
jgi:mono/diheme cytochrome c family protein